MGWSGKTRKGKEGKRNMEWREEGFQLLSELVRLTHCVTQLCSLKCSWSPRKPSLPKGGQTPVLPCLHNWRAAQGVVWEGEDGGKDGQWESLLWNLSLSVKTHSPHTIGWLRELSNFFHFQKIVLGKQSLCNVISGCTSTKRQQNGLQAVGCNSPDLC